MLPKGKGSLPKAAGSEPALAGRGLASNMGCKEKIVTKWLKQSLEKKGNRDNSMGANSVRCGLIHTLKIDIYW
jgi:hypothetical protein